MIQLRIFENSLNYIRANAGCGGAAAVGGGVAPETHEDPPLAKRRAQGARGAGARGAGARRAQGAGARPKKMLSAHRVLWIGSERDYKVGAIISDWRDFSNNHFWRDGDLRRAETTAFRCVSRLFLCPSRRGQMGDMFP